MTPTKQGTANQRQSTKDLGPKTAPSKARSRTRTKKNRDAAGFPVLADEDRQAYRARLLAWTGHLAPVGPVESYLVERAVHLSWQLDRADRCQVARLDQAVRGAVADTGESPGAAERKAFDDSRAGERLRRHQLACGRMLLRTLEAFNWIHEDGEPPTPLGFSDSHDECVGAEDNEEASSASRHESIGEGGTPSQPENDRGVIESILAEILAGSLRDAGPSAPAAPCEPLPLGFYSASHEAREEFTLTTDRLGTRGERTTTDERRDQRPGRGLRVFLAARNRTPAIPHGQPPGRPTLVSRTRPIA